MSHVVFASVLVRGEAIVKLVDVGLDREGLVAFADSFNELAAESGTEARIVPWSDNLATAPRQTNQQRLEPADTELAEAHALAVRVNQQFEALGYDVSVRVDRDSKGQIYYRSFMASDAWDFGGELVPEMILAALRLELSDTGRALKAERAARLKAERQSRRESAGAC